MKTYFVFQVLFLIVLIAEGMASDLVVMQKNSARYWICTVQSLPQNYVVISGINAYSNVNFLISNGDTSTTPMLTTNDVTNITDSSAELSAILHNPNQEVVMQKGFEWRSNDSIYYVDFTNIVEGATAFEGTLADLYPRTTYAVRAFVDVGSGRVLGEEFFFTTLDGDDVYSFLGTNDVTNITSTSAELHATIYNYTTENILRKGFQWKDSGTLDYHEFVDVVETPDGFKGILTGLNGLESYTVRAFVDLASGRVFGEEKSFVTNRLRLTDVDPYSTPIKVFPNPTTGTIYVGIEDGEQRVRLDVLDIEGKVVVSQKIEGVMRNTVVSLDLGSVGSGIYFLHVQGDGRDRVVKVIVQ